MQGQQRHVPRIGPQEERLARGIFGAADDADAQIRRFVAVTNRAIPYRAVVNGLLQAGNRQATVDKPGGKNDPLAENARRRTYRGEASCGPLQFQGAAGFECDAIGVRLSPERVEQLWTGYAVGKPRIIVGFRNEL